MRLVALAVEGDEDHVPCVPVAEHARAVYLLALLRQKHHADLVRRLDLLVDRPHFLLRHARGFARHRERRDRRNGDQTALQNDVCVHFCFSIANGFGCVFTDGSFTYAWSRPMYSQGAFDAQSPKTKRMPYQMCEVTTPNHVMSHIAGLSVNEVRSVASA